MAYTKQDFQPNTTLYASELNAMDEQIALNETNIQTVSEQASSNTERITVAKSLLDTTRTEVNHLWIKTQYFNGTHEDGFYITDSASNVVTYIDRNGTYSTNFTTPNGNFNDIAIKHTVTSEIWKGSAQQIYLHLSGLIAGKSYKIELMRRPSRSSNAKRWQSFPNVYGYAMLEKEGYREVPTFMTNNGVLRTNWEFTATGTDYTLILDAPVWLLDLCKPYEDTEFTTTDGELVGLIGQSFVRPFKMLCLTFYIYDENNTLISKPSENLYINGSHIHNGKDIGSNIKFGLCLRDDGTEVRLDGLRISIK